MFPPPRKKLDRDTNRVRLDVESGELIFHVFWRDSKRGKREMIDKPGNYVMEGKRCDKPRLNPRTMPHNLPNFFITSRLETFSSSQLLRLIHVGSSWSASQCERPRCLMIFHLRYWFVIVIIHVRGSIALSRLSDESFLFVNLSLCLLSSNSPRRTCDSRN